MALIGLKQLDSPLTGSLKVSGSGELTGSLTVGGTLFGPVDDHFDIKSDKDVRVYLDKDNDGSFHKFQVFNEDGDVKFAIASDGKSAIGGAVTSTSLDGLSVTGGITATGNVTASGHISSSGDISGSGIYSGGPITISDSGTSTPTAKILVRSSNNKLNIGDTIVVTDSNNRVGLGDSSPSSPDTELHIKSDTPVVTLQRTDNDQKGAIDFQGQGGTVGASIEFVADTNDISIQTFDGSGMHEKMRIQDGAEGNIKVSGSTQITGSLYVSGAYYGDGSNLTGITSGIFQQTGSSQNTTNDLQITGSLLASGAVTASHNVEVGGDLLVTEYIRHKGDVNTNIRFTDNRIRFNAGNMTFLGLHDDDDAPFTATINPSSNKINFKAMDENNDLLLKTNSETFKVELYHAGSEKLTTEAGGINVTGHITGSANISSSATGSFGRIEAGAITASRVDVDAGTIAVGGVGLTKTMVENITGSFGVELPGQTILSGSLESTASAAKITAGTTVETDKIESLTADPKSRIYLSHPSNKKNAQLALNYRSYNVFEATGSGDNMSITIGSDANSARSDITLQGFTAGGAADKVSAIFVEGVGSKIGMGGITSPTTAVHISGSGDSNLYVEGQISSSQWVSASTYYGDGSNLTGIQSGVFQATGSSLNVTDDLQITGSLKVNAALTSSTAIYTNNIQNGYPTSNNWGESLDGSYFNNFDNTTHVSEILRFIAGAMSHSLDVSDAAPNTKYWNTVSTSHTEGSTTSKNSLLDGVLGSTYENARLSQHWTSSAFIDMSETGSYRAVQDYLILKGWVLTSDRGDFGNDTGTNPFHGSYASRIPSTIQTQGTFGTNSHTVTANAGGSTSVSSNANYFGLGGLTSGGATAYSVRVIASHSFSDNYDDTTPDKNSTHHTHSFVDYTQDSFGTSGDGLILSKIVTSQPAVIPSAYQDGDFNSVAGSISGRFYSGSTSATSISASGYYATHDVVVGLKSGSQSDYVFKDGSDSNTRFYLYAGGLPSDITNSQPTAVVTSSAHISAFAATSRSLSGAPYLLTTTYTVLFESEVSKSFDPCYGYGTSVLVNSNTTDTWENIGSTTLSNTTVSVTNSGVSSTGANTYVIDSTKSTKRSSSGIPHRSDIAVASSSLSFTLDSNTENVGQNRSNNNTLNYSLVFRARGRNWKNTAVDSSSGTISLYNATLFGQHADSGSMAVYSRAQGYDSNTLQDTTETFTGEDFRIVLADNVQAFNGAYFTTDSFQTNDEGDSTLGRNDLQVKPGYLVDPTGSYGYWFTNDSLQESNEGYRYYIRRFQTDGGTKSSMTVNLSSKTLVAWNSTSDGIACAILYESSGNGSGNNSSLGRARIYDPTATTSNLIEANISQDHIKNPFSTAIDLYGNTGGSISSGTYTMPIRNADGMYLDASDNELYVIVRYKGDPAPISAITLSFS